MLLKGAEKIKNISAFESKYNELKDWLEKNKRLPNYYDSDETEKSLCEFIQLQKQKHKRNTMNDEELKLMCELPYFKFLELTGSKTTKDFCETYNRLKEWIITNDRLPNYYSKDKNEKSLRGFIRNQEIHYKNDKLNDERIKLMNELPYFKLPVSKEKQVRISFEDRCTELREWILKNNRLPKSYSTEIIEKTLGIFIYDQKRHYKTNTLSEIREKMLTDLPYFKWPDTKKIKARKSFEINYSELKEWIIANDRLPKAISNDINEKNMRLFMNRQKTYLKNNKLCERKIKLMNELPYLKFSETPPKNIHKSFKVKYSELKEWVKINNRLPTCTIKDVTERSLYLFIHQQKHKHKKNKLSEERVKLMSEIPNFKFLEGTQLITNTFKTTYCKLKEWVDTNNKLPCYNSIDINEKALAVFINNQKMKYKKNKLSDEQTKLMCELTNFKFFKPDETRKHVVFEDTCKELKEWILKNNRLPTSVSRDADEKKLTLFINNQKNIYKNKKLTCDKIKLMTELPYFKFPELNEANE